MHILLILSMIVGAPWPTPEDDGVYVYAMGEGHGGSRQEALEAAWYSALSALATGNIPEVTRAHSSLKESNTAVEYRGEARLDLDRVRWKGVEEVRRAHAVRDGKEWTAFRLVRWSRQDVEAARAPIVNRPKGVKDVVASLTCRSELEEVVAMLGKPESVHGFDYGWDSWVVTFFDRKAAYVMRVDYRDWHKVPCE